LVSYLDETHQDINQSTKIILVLMGFEPPLISVITNPGSTAQYVSIPGRHSYITERMGLPTFLDKVDMAKHGFWATLSIFVRSPRTNQLPWINNMASDHEHPPGMSCRSQHMTIITTPSPFASDYPCPIEVQLLCFTLN